MKSDQRLTKGPNGRDSKGRFKPGCKPGPGNPHAAAVSRWRKGLIEAVTPEDITAVVLVLVQEAKAGRAWAVRELLDRTLGKAVQAFELEGALQSGGAFPDDFLAYLDWKAKQAGGNP